ncbi:MAG: PEP-CTERM sorting domain-containing protein [Burkholderiales bacterium]|jgi:hypothetical protein|nr:PEP-CTERM sorting domain-containing protein [Burkholderiales bacterium]
MAGYSGVLTGTAVPEPSAVALLLAGSAVLAIVPKKKQRYVQGSAAIR